MTSTDAPVTGIDLNVNPRGCYVYLLWGTDPDRPLWIGRSSRNVFIRIGMAIRNPDFGPLAQSASLVPCEDHADTLETELRLIHELHPIWNSVGVPAERPEDAGPPPEDRPEIVSYP